MTNAYHWTHSAHKILKKDEESRVWGVLYKKCPTTLSLFCMMMMMMDIHLVFFILCTISFESSKGFLFPSHVRKYKRCSVTSPLSFHTNYYSSQLQATPDEFQNDCTANVADINVNYLQLVRKLNMVGVICHVLLLNPHYCVWSLD